MSNTIKSVSDQSEQQLTDLVEQALAQAKQQGASSVETAVSRSQGMSVTVRLGEVETVEHNRDKSLVVSVYFGHKSGSASTSDFTPAAVTDTVRAACTIAKFTAEDPYNGLADREHLATDIPELDLYYPWPLDMDEAITLARRCEDTARGTDSRITNSEGASVSSHEALEVYANSHGFMGSVASTRHGLSCAVIGVEDNGMQRDYWYSAARDAAQLDSPEEVGRVAAERTVRRLNARKISTRSSPVVFEAPVAASLLSHLTAAIRGASLYRKASFLLDHLGKQVFADHVRIHEQPHLRKALGSAPFDNEGVATKARDLVSDGILRGYVLDSYSARKLGMETTGNSGGVHNLTADSGTYDFEGLLRQMGTGLLVTELIGYGVNMVTGDYSRGAAGFWVEHGEICYPVEEITVAGNLKEMFRGITEFGTDVDLRRSTRTGSILVDHMTVAGA
ncbi:MAG: metalloprotease PmbA [Gammaproteobacteria bacterium]|nr:metalloprotease PmbA [Gammaproteobacteria bacterium]